MSTRTEWVDYAKAIGIILVVFGHVNRGIYDAGFGLPESIHSVVDSVIYSFHMPLFFFLSGLFCMESFRKRGGTGVLKAKIDTLIYPYLLWSLLQGSIEVGLSNYTNGSTSFSDLIQILWAPRAQFWFLYVLFAIFCVMAVYFSMVKRRQVELLFVLSVLLYLFRGSLPESYLLNLIAINLVYFVLGIVFAENMSRNEEWLRPQTSLLACLLIFIVLQWLFHFNLGYRHYDKGVMTLTIATIAIALVICLSITLSKVKVGWLQVIGLYSMQIYLMHILTGSGARIMMSKIFHVDSTLIHLVVGTIAGVVLPIVLTKVIERVNIHYLFSAPVCDFIFRSKKKAL
ncbi:acyltransferase [Vibrio vulnificus]|nr:acyltransferase [Vibrio vulnificus]ELK2279872.1 acyltransferase [Vibrio vulnificus]